MSGGSDRKASRKRVRENRRQVNISPTRAELRELRRRLQLVQRGHDLLERKQDTLMMEFFRTLEDYRRVETSVAHQSAAAGRAATMSAMAAGELEAGSFALTRAGCVHVETQPDSFMGVSLVNLQPAAVHSATRPVTAETPWHFEAARQARELVKQLASLAGAEARLRGLLDEIERTKRRVNALEIKVIPDLEDQAAFMASALEELERESMFRLKRVKSKITSSSALS
jgi:V/A-type H+-transporting ATPase subunit D